MRLRREHNSRMARLGLSNLILLVDYLWSRFCGLSVKKEEFGYVNERLCKVFKDFGYWYSLSPDIIHCMVFSFAEDHNNEAAVAVMADAAHYFQHSVDVFS